MSIGILTPILLFSLTQSGCSIIINDSVKFRTFIECRRLTEVSPNAHCDFDDRRGADFHG